MTAKIQGIVAEQGAALSVTLTRTDGDLTGRNLRMHVRSLVGEITTKLVASTTDGRLTVASETSATLLIPSDVMAAVSVTDAREQWVYDIESWTDSEDVRREWKGIFEITRDVTRDTEADEEDRLAGLVRYDSPQSLTDAQKTQARDNIGAGTGGSGGAWGSITGTLASQTDLQAALDLKAPLASPTLTGTPAAPTAAGGTSTTQIATTAFVGSAVSTHAGATDPHGDRAFATSAVSTHAALTTGVHGITAAGAALLDDADAAAQRTTLGLVIGTDIQAYDAELAAIASLTSAADKGVMFSGVGTAATFDLTAAARTVLDDTTTAAMLTTLGAQAALVSGTNIKTINSTSLLGSGDIAISASPGGSTLQPQYNAAGSFAGMAGVSWDDTNRAETRTGATVTTSNPVQSFTQTWNAAGVTFTGWKLNVTNTASASGSLLADWQVGGVSQAKLRKDGWLFLADGAGIAGITATTTGIQVNYGGNNPDINIFTNSTERALFYGNGVAFSGSIQIGSATKYGGDVFLSRNASGVAEFTNGSTGTFRDLKLRTLIASETVKLASYTVATVPSASTSGAGATIYVSDETGGAVVAFSDATNWRRVTDRAVIS